MSKYDDIINIPHPTSLKHPRMSMQARAAQFAPFAALTGYEEAIEETGRQTDEFIILDEESIAILNDKLNYLNSNLDKNTEVKIEYFIKDDKKQGGTYKTVKGIIKKIDEIDKVLILKDKTRISLIKIINIEY